MTAQAQKYVQLKDEAVPLQFSDAMMELAIAAQVNDIHQLLIKTYWRALRDIPLPQLIRAMETMCRTMKNSYGRIPQPGDIRDAAMGGNARSLEGRAAAAWDAVQRAIVAYGTCRPVDFDDPAINAAVRSLGGWAQMGRVDPARSEWMRGQFVKTYQTYCSRGFPEQMGKALESNGGGILTGAYGQKPTFVQTGLPGARPRPALEQKLPDPMLELMQGTMGAMAS